MIDLELTLLLDKFNCYEFVEDTHQYFWNGCPVDISVTGFIQRYFPKFDFENISTKYANKHNLDVEEVRKSWKLKGDIASTSGTIIHSHIENLKRGKRFEFDYSTAIQKGILDEVKERVNILLPKAEKFHKDTLNKLYPLKLEYTVGLNTKLAGNVDMLCWNQKAQEIQIWDYKNTKGIQTKNDYYKMCYSPFNFLDDCSYSHYCMQLNFYKAMIERELNLHIGKMYLVSFDYTQPGDSYCMYECIDLQNICRKELDILDGR